MPISILDVSNVAPIGDYGNNDIFSNMLKMRESQKAAEDRGLQNEGKRHQNTILGAEAQYAPDKFKFANAIQEAKARYAAEQEQADVQQKLAHAFNLRQQGNYAGGQEPESVRIAKFLTDPKIPPETKEQARKLAGLMGAATGNIEEKIIDAGLSAKVFVPGGIGKQAQNQASTYNKNLEKTANGKMKVENSAKRLKNIIAENPNLSNSFSAIMADPENRNTILEKLAAAAVNQKERAAVEKFSKDATDLVVGMQEMNASGKTTDALRELWARTKPNFRNTDEANLYVLDKIAEENLGGKEMLDAIRFADNNGLRVVYDEAEFRELGRAASNKGNPSTNNAVPNNAQAGMIKMVTPSGEKHAVSLQHMEGFLKKYPGSKEWRKE